jgi:hypothetical protein
MLTSLDLARLLHDTCERLMSTEDFLPMTFRPDSPDGRLLVATCEDILQYYTLVGWPNASTSCLEAKVSAAVKAGAIVFERFQTPPGPAVVAAD